MKRSRRWLITFWLGRQVFKLLKWRYGRNLKQHLEKKYDVEVRSGR